MHITEIVINLIMTLRTIINAIGFISLLLCCIMIVHSEDEEYGRINSLATSISVGVVIVNIVSMII